MNNNDDLIPICSLGGLSLLSSDDLDPQTFNASRLEQGAALESLMRRASTTALPPSTAVGMPRLASPCLALPRPAPTGLAYSLVRYSKTCIVSSTWLRACCESRDYCLI